jgi:hypothetical protein
MTIDRWILSAVVVPAVFALTSIPALATDSSSDAPRRAYDPAPRIAAQRDAMKPLAALDGEWRGTATITMPNGSMVSTHTERVGPMLDGSIKVIEGRSYAQDGSVVFNAFAVISFDPTSKAYTFRSYAQGHSGDHPFRATADGFVWEMARGPVTTRYTTVIKDGTWTEIGERIEAGKEPVRFIELKLQRIGDSPWPTAGAVARQ